MDNNPDDLDRSVGNGKTFVYNEEDDTWKNFGGVDKYPLVSKDNDGLIYPDLYDRLKQIEASNDLSNLKLTEHKPYFYNFISTDKLVKFNTEENNFRIEVDRGAVSRKLATMPCVGKRGVQGAVGKGGRNGVPARNEKYRPVFQDGSFSLSVNTPNGDTTPISFRGFSQNEQKFEALIFANGNVEDVDGGLTEVSFTGDFNDGRIDVTGILADPDLRFKVRQRGADGIDGIDGVNYVQVFIDDASTNGQFTEVVGMLRFNTRLNILTFKRTSVNALFNNVLNIVPTPNLPNGDYWAAVEITSNDRKAVEYHHFASGLDAPPLDLPSYVPLSGCYNQKRYAAGYMPAPQGTPFTFVTDPFPDYISCKDPFWFCGIGDSCDGGINVNPGVTNPPFDISTSSDSSETSESTLSDSSESEESFSEESFSEESPESFSDESFSDESFSDESFSDESFSDESFSEESFSEESFSDESFSDESDSPESFSEESFSEESLSEVSESPESFSDESFSDASPESFSDESFSEESFSDESFSDASPESFSEESFSEESFSDASLSEESFSDESFSEDSFSSDSEDPSSSSSSGVGIFLRQVSICDDYPYYEGDCCPGISCAPAEHVLQWFYNTPEATVGHDFIGFAVYCDSNSEIVGNGFSNPPDGDLGMYWDPVPGPLDDSGTVCLDVGAKSEHTCSAPECDNWWFLVRNILGFSTEVVADGPIIGSTFYEITGFSSGCPTVEPMGIFCDTVGGGCGEVFEYDYYLVTASDGFRYEGNFTCIL